MKSHRFANPLLSRCIQAFCVGLSVILLVGLVVATSPNGIWSNDVSMTDGEEAVDPDNTLILIEESEIPLAGKPSQTKNTTTKTTTKKKTLKKKAKKSVIKTKVTTKKSSNSNFSNGFRKKVDKTVKTTVKTTEKKSSKVQTIQTTVTTLTVTTMTAEKAGVIDINSIAKKADSKLLQRFQKEGYQIKVDPSQSYQGVFRTSPKEIGLQEANNIVYHELGHYLAYTTGRRDYRSAFVSIYNKEKSKYTASNKAYVLKNQSEYFAESYKNYVENPGALKSQRPQTYAYIQSVLEML